LRTATAFRRTADQDPSGIMLLIASPMITGGIASFIFRKYGS
jgi:hypothetical protein